MTFGGPKNPGTLGLGFAGLSRCQALLGQLELEVDKTFCAWRCRMYHN